MGWHTAVPLAGRTVVAGEVEPLALGWPGGVGFVAVHGENVGGVSARFASLREQEALQPEIGRLPATPQTENWSWRRWLWIWGRLDLLGRWFPGKMGPGCSGCGLNIPAPNRAGIAPFSALSMRTDGITSAPWCRYTALSACWVYYWGPRPVLGSIRTVQGPGSIPKNGRRKVCHPRRRGVQGRDTRAWRRHASRSGPRSRLGAAPGL